MLKTPAEIKRVLDHGRRVAGRWVNIYRLPQKDTRFAVLVSRRLGKAVRRNHMKRLVREIYRLHPEWFEHRHTVIYLKRFRNNFLDLQNEIKRLVEKTS